MDSQIASEHCTNNLNDFIQTANIDICVRNKDTLQQFSSFVYLDLEYLPKLLKWISKNKFTIEEMLQDCKLTIGGVFSYSLPRSTKSDTDIIREELKLLKQEKVSLMRD